jgi:hypothetical protein
MIYVYSRNLNKHVYSFITVKHNNPYQGKVYSQSLPYLSLGLYFFTVHFHHSYNI